MKALSYPVLRHPVLLAAILGGFLVSACAVTAQDRERHPRIASYAIAQSEDTSIGAALEGDVARHKGQSGFLLIDKARESLSIRLAMVEAAERTLDLQYYIVHDDGASKLMLEAILRAAERGVRVRFLIDGITFSEVSKDLAILDHQNNIEIRVFNPVVKPTIPLMAKIYIGFIDLARFYKRMHNKSLIVDNQLAVIGGRNLGDEYFDENTDVNFTDLDILTAGPVTDRISHSFDRYWNDEHAYLIADLQPEGRTKEELDALRADMKREWAEKMDATGSTLHMERLADVMKRGDLGLTWAPAFLSVDPPEKIDAASEAEGAEASAPLTHLLRVVKGGQQEFVAITPYFVPTDEGVAFLKGLVDRGMKVRVVTNSLASTDVVAVHAGYRRYRMDLLKAGVELYEYKPVGGERPKQRLAGSTAPTASLHSKAYVIDGRDVVVGSYNLDPRSTELNTEIAVIIRSETLAQKTRALFDDAIRPENAHRVMLDGDGDVRWVTTEDGKEKTYSTEPGAGIWRRVEAGFMGLLPIEKHL